MNRTGTQTIITHRLTLRRFVMEDAEDMYRGWASDPEVTRFLTWPAHGSVEVTRMVLGSWVARYEDGAFFNWAIEWKESGRVIGSIAVVKLNEETGAADIGYCLSRALWRKGVMTEALKALCAALFEAGYSMIRIEAVRENIGSNRVIQKAGFRFANSREQPMSESKPEIVTINSYYLPRE